MPVNFVWTSLSLLTFKWPRQADNAAAPQRVAEERSKERYMQECKEEIIRFSFRGVKKPLCYLVTSIFSGTLFAILNIVKLLEEISHYDIKKCIVQIWNEMFRVAPIKGDRNLRNNHLVSHPRLWLLCVFFWVEGLKNCVMNQSREGWGILL